MRKIKSASGSGMFKAVLRKISWFWHGLTPQKAVNLAVSGAQFYLNSEKAYNMPVIVKIDISPACNLRCPSCVHGLAGDDPKLQTQDLSNRHKMDIPHYNRLIDQIKGKTSAVSLTSGIHWRTRISRKCVRSPAMPGWACTSAPTSVSA